MNNCVPVYSFLLKRSRRIGDRQKRPCGMLLFFVVFFLLLLNICLNKNCLRTVKLYVVGAALNLRARAVVGPLVPCSSLRVWGKMGRLGCFSCPRQLL